jgi:predicted house-cleaning noncanonical NTP pyrophosphatase (MazG superfamily)
VIVKLIRDAVTVKLIRDLVPVDDGGTELERTDGTLRELLLSQKLEEEAGEVRLALDAFYGGRGSATAIAEELADVCEVVRALAEIRVPGGWDEVERVRERKLAARGGFRLGRRYRRATP